MATEMDLDPFEGLRRKGEGVVAAPKVMLVILDGINNDIYKLYGTPPIKFRDGSHLQNYPEIFKALYVSDGRLHVEKVRAVFDKMTFVDQPPESVREIIHLWWD